MKPDNRTLKIVAIALLIVVISVLHLGTRSTMHHFHVVYRELYFLPLILAAFWFGFRGGITASLAITAIYLPYTIIHWQSFSPDDLDKVLEIALYNIVAVILGTLRDRERTRQREKLEAVLAIAGSVAHELNTPLFTLLGNAQLLQSEFEPGSANFEDAQEIIDSAKKMREIIEKISRIDRIRFTDYVGDTRIADIDPASS